jgi:ADP-ribose pyrophosphatase YjhB (NUDIX family)
LADARWLDWVRRLQAIAQNGLHYDPPPFDRERFEQVRAVAAEMAAAGGAGASPEELVAAFAAETGHATPKLDVRAVAFRDGRVLMVRGLDDGRWTLPGGWAEVGESPRAAVEKELLEESGHAGRAVRLLALLERDLRTRPRFPMYAWKAYFLCELEAGEPAEVHAAEVTEVGFFPEDDLPELSERTPRAQLDVALARARDLSLPAAFD